jgi:hypothetical protein
MSVVVIPLSIQLLTVTAVDQFIADLKACIEEAKVRPVGSGDMVSVYGMFVGQWHFSCILPC